MKLTKSKLQQIIKEEVKAIIESSDDWAKALQQPVRPQALGPEDEPEGESEDVDLGQQGPTNREQLLDAAEILIDKLGRDLSEEDIGVLYDVAMYINNHGEPDDPTLEKIINMDRPFSDMPMAIHDPSR
jgi:hypothetical protein